MESLESASLAVWHATYVRAALIVGGIRRQMIMVSISRDGALLTGEHDFGNGAAGRLELEHHLGPNVMYADVEVRDGAHGREEHERLVNGLRVRFARMTSDMRTFVENECSRPQYSVAIVDDNASHLWGMQAMLIALGFRVVGINNPIGATNRIAKSDVQLVLISSEMSGLNGNNLCRLLRYHPKTQAIAILMHAGGSEDVLAESANIAGADGYLHRRADTATVVQRILLHSHKVDINSSTTELAKDGFKSYADNNKVQREKRADRRITYLASWQLTELANGIPFRGYTANISRGGVALYLTRQLVSGSSVCLSLREDDSLPVREIIGTVRWVKRLEPFYTTGIAFNFRDDSVRRAVGKIVDRLVVN
ncbi:MAG: PilZ domain-containing protein [Deltaproteobacteria bacterium]|nr:PilZ domain-containing protein [Deltaproteobacteria bacterium]